LSPKIQKGCTAHGESKDINIPILTEELDRDFEKEYKEEIQTMLILEYIRTSIE
jgi:hypothetical protein